LTQQGEVSSTATRKANRGSLSQVSLENGEMVETPGADATPDWRRAETYNYTRDLPRRAWAWEFLRRNPAYKHAWLRCRDSFQAQRRGSLLIVRSMPIARRNLVPWGLLFRRCAGSRCHRGNHLLESRRMPTCAAGDRAYCLVARTRRISPVRNSLSLHAAGFAKRCSTPLVSCRRSIPSTGRLGIEPSRPSTFAYRCRH